MKKPVKVYTPLMRYDKILFAIQDLELPFPVTYRQIGFFFGTLLFMILFVHLPGLGFLESSWLINYVAIPIAATWFFTKFKLDGKAPLRYIHDYIRFKLMMGIYNRYEKIDTPDQYKYTTVVTYRNKGDESQ